MSYSAILHSQNTLEQFGLQVGFFTEDKNGDKATPPLTSLEEPLESRCVKFPSHSFKEDLWILPRFPKLCERPTGVTPSIM